MNKNRDEYIPPVKYPWLTSLNDLLLFYALRESTFKPSLVEQSQPEKGHRVLDVGCGTGTLTLLIKKARPEAEVVGIDGDRKVLEIATRKVAKAGLDVTLDHGMAFDLPYPDGSFDRVLSSLLFHHLTRENKVGTLREIFRVLRPSGELHVADWGKPHNWLMRVAFLSVRMLDGFKTTADNVNGLLPGLIGHVGFEDIQESRRYMTMSGTLWLYKGRGNYICFAAPTNRQGWLAPSG